MNGRQGYLMCLLYDSVFETAQPNAFRGNPGGAINKAVSNWSTNRPTDLAELDELVETTIPSTSPSVAKVDWKDHYVMRLFRMEGSVIPSDAYDSLIRRLERLAKPVAA